MTTCMTVQVIRVVAAIEQQFDVVGTHLRSQAIAS